MSSEDQQQDTAPKGRKTKEVLKEFKLTSFFLKNRTTVFVLAAIIAIGGVISYNGMPREAFPEVVIPNIYVGTPYPGNSPLDIEKLITRPLEKEIGSISGIDKMTSTSVQGYSTISVEFDFSVTPEEALRKVKDKVDVARADADFPKDLPADPNIFEMNMSEMTPVMNVNLSGNYSIDQLEEYAEYLEDEIEDLPEINEVDIRGVQEKEMKVKVDMAKMESNELSFNDISTAIANENMTISGGDILLDDMRRTVRVVGDFTSAEDIGNVIVKNEKFHIVYLRDIAEVVFEDKEKETYAREYEKSVVMVDIKKRAGANLINASDKINEILADAKENVFPEDLEITITGDQSRATRTQVSELENSIIFGVLLVVLVLLFFLGLRNALFVGIAIPASMFMSFMILSAMGVTLNMMVLFALVLALGMLVDNGIVVVENVYRLMDQGMPALKAARYGVGEVAWPIIASTATTLAAFLPLAIWPGLMGEFMKWLPITLMIVLGSSLFVALVLNPVFVAVYMKVGNEKGDSKTFLLWTIGIIVAGIIVVASGGEAGGMVFLITIILTILSRVIKGHRFRNMATVGGLLGLGLACAILGSVIFGNLLIYLAGFALLNRYVLDGLAEKFQNRLLPWLEGLYKGFLRFALTGAGPAIFLGGTFVMLIFSFVLMGITQPKVEFFPKTMPNYINVFVEAPIGTDIEKVNGITKELESRIMTYNKKWETEREENGIKYVHNTLIESVIAQVGAGTSDPMAGPSMEATPHKARIQVSFRQFADRPDLGAGIVNTNDVLEDIRGVVRGVPGVRIWVQGELAGPPQGKPVNIEVTGDDYEQLLAEAERVKIFIDSRNIPGIEELKLDVDAAKPEMPIVIDRAKARRFNLSTAQVGMALRNALFGLEVQGSFKDGEDDYKIMVRLDDKYRYNVDALMNQKITFRDQMTGKIRQIPISAVATPQKSATFSAVKRKEQKRLITIDSNVLDAYNANEVVAEIKEALEDYDLPDQNTLAFTGQQEEQAKEMDFLLSALGIAVGLIFLIMVSQFNSAATPFIIITSVGFSLIGVLLGLIAFNMSFIIIMTMVGIISLAGIVVNNAIVLLDYTDLIILRRKAELGLDEKARLSMADLTDAIVEGGKTRLRPVLLTAITTILGLVPLAIGLNIDFIGLLATYDPAIYVGGDNVVFWGPMSWTVIFGLTFATFLTLVVVPVMFLLKMRLKYRLAESKEATPEEDYSAPNMGGVEGGLAGAGQLSPDAPQENL